MPRVPKPCLAVRLYNDPSESRSFEGFIVHMHLAWLYLLHAEFLRDGIDYRYRQKDSPRRFANRAGCRLRRRAVMHFQASKSASDPSIRTGRRFSRRRRR
jgi:hypothetical protein